MTSSLRALLGGTLDYAGLFPPAALSMDEAAAMYARHRGDEHAWMLSRFVVPATRLSELASSPSRPKGPSDPWKLAVLAGSGDEAKTFLPSAKRDLETAATFERELGERYLIQSVEFRIPESLFERGTAASLSQFLGLLVEESGRTLFWTPLVFFEIPSSVTSRTASAAAMARVAELHRQTPDREMALKIRTGGVTPASVPSSEDVAEFLTGARGVGLGMKATAGLHHPLRGYVPEVHGVMHGFLNLFVAAVLAHARGLEAPAIRGILDEEDFMRFRFDDDGLAWKDHEAPVDAIETARREFALGFGSCSFEEPRDDLRGLGLL